jgi:hypothetical protein
MLFSNNLKVVNKIVLVFSSVFVLIISFVIFAILGFNSPDFPSFWLWLLVSVVHFRAVNFFWTKDEITQTYSRERLVFFSLFLSPILVPVLMFFWVF